MAETPRNARAKADMDHPAVKRGLKAAYDDGEQAGLDQGRLEIIDFLEQRYLKDADRPDRGTPQADAMLQLAREAADYFRPRVGTKTKGNKRK